MNMQPETRQELTTVRDLKPSMKNLNMIFIVLEIGKIFIKILRTIRSSTAATFLYLKVDQMLLKRDMK